MAEMGTGPSDSVPDPARTTQRREAHAVVQVHDSATPAPSQDAAEPTLTVSAHQLAAAMRSLHWTDFVYHDDDFEDVAATLFAALGRGKP